MQALPHAGVVQREQQPDEGMVERRPLLTIFSHLILALGVAVVALPLWLTFVASTHPVENILRAPIPVWPGGHMIENYSNVLGQGVAGSSSGPVGEMMLNSLVMAVGIAVGKIAISILSAFAIVYFRFPLRMLAFWTIFLTLMLPVEVRILPTFEVVANLGLLNSYWGLTVPLIASATATFLFRQFFLTVPDELTEAARIDGAGPLKFFKDILLPLSRTNIAALFVILFIYGWNQYLWPLLITTDESMYTIVMGIQRMVTVADSEPLWNLTMAVAMLALLPPVVVVLVMQRWFVKGLIETEK
jgi:sn-glycerol 3-phosphate transport system permease protein